MTDNDPRVFFAAERTLLAWVRTGITTMGLGFVVARFGLFLRIMAPEHLPRSHGLSAGLGFALVMLGAGCCMIAAAQFTRYLRSLPVNAIPPLYSRVPAVGLAVGLATVGVVLAVYLVL